MSKTTRKLRNVTQTQPPKTIPLMATQPAVSALPQPLPAQVKEPKAARVCLEFLKPDAKQVCVAGSFNGWKPDQTPLVKVGNGRWVGDLSVNPGRYEYLFVVDGQWLLDPNAKETVQNPYGGKNAVLTVSE